MYPIIDTFWSLHWISKEIQYDKKCNNKIPNIENVNNNPAWISTYLQSRHQRRLARTGYLWLPEPRPRVAELQPPSDGSGSRSRSRRLDPSANTNDTGSKLQWKIYLSVIENVLCVCVQRAASLLHIHPILTLTNDLCVSKPGSKLGLIWCPFSFNVLRFVELLFKILKNLLSI